METAVVYWGYIGIMENEMETTICGAGCWLQAEAAAGGGRNFVKEALRGVLKMMVICGYLTLGCQGRRRQGAHEGTYKLENQSGLATGDASEGRSLKRKASTGCKL